MTVAAWLLAPAYQVLCCGASLSPPDGEGQCPSPSLSLASGLLGYQSCSLRVLYASPLPPSPLPPSFAFSTK